MLIYNWFKNNRQESPYTSRIKVIRSFLMMRVQDTNVRKIPHNNIKLSPQIIHALGGHDNIETCHTVPNSKRIRLTLNNPALVNTAQLEKIPAKTCIRIGKKIIHIIP